MRIVQVTTFSCAAVAAALRGSRKVCTLNGALCRRGRPDCGDIDILITHQQAAPLDGTLDQLIRSLHAMCFLTDDLVHSKKVHTSDVWLVVLPT